jgi:hypothetical protein
MAKYDLFTLIICYKLEEHKAKFRRRRAA